MCANMRINDKWWLWDSMKMLFQFSFRGGIICLHEVFLVLIGPQVSFCRTYSCIYESHNYPLTHGRATVLRPTMVQNSYLTSNILGVLWNHKRILVIIFCLIVVYDQDLLKTGFQTLAMKVFCYKNYINSSLVKHLIF